MPDSAAMIRRSIYSVVFGVILALLGHVCAQAQDAGIQVNERTVSLAISDKRQVVQSDTSLTSLMGLGEKGPISVKAVGDGSRHFWSLFSIKNTGSEPLNFVMTFQPQNFAGAGLLRPELTVQEVLSAVSLRDGDTMRLTDGGGWQYTYVAVAPNDTTNIAVETDGPAISATLWRASYFGSVHVGPLFLTGLMQGMAILALMALLGLYTFKPTRVTLAGVLFGVSLLLFIEGDLGLFALPVLEGGLNAALVRAWVETLVAATAMICVVTFHSPLAARRFVYAAMLSGIVAAGLANMVYAGIEPLNASAIARVVFLACVALGVVLGFTSRHVKHRIGFDWLFWLALVVWTGLAALLAATGRSVPNGQMWLAGATLMLLFVVTLVLIRFVADLRRGESPALLRTELRSVALAAGQHILWEWQPETGLLSVGPELPRRLNLDPQEWEEDGRGNFHAALHPVDLGAYQNLAERVDFKPGESASLELRLHGQDGIYHWYRLQARSIRGAQNATVRVIGTLTDIDRLKNAADHLTLDTAQDQITGLPNRTLFLDQLDRLLAQAGAPPFRLVMLDIDRFKELNEGLGQEAGNTILKTVAHRITDLLGAEESVARLNGGQFVLQFTESPARGTLPDFLHALEEAVALPIEFGEQEVVISISTGISSFSAAGLASQDLMDQAGVAMLEARKGGGARVVFYDTAMTDDRAKLFSLESDLRRALARHEIEIYYQPVVDLLTLRVRGFEALARWRHPELGLLSPSEFMDIAETSGLMTEITKFMMLGAARQLGIWKRVHMRGEPFWVSVNVSASQLVDPQFVSRVQSVLLRELPEPGSFKIEITETVIMRQPERSAQVLRQLRAMGVGLACDDFGSGFSSLASLRDLPFDTLKIDRSFISAGNFEERNSRIIGSITALAAGLNMAVVAEGIETQEQIDALAELGCTLGQGYLLGMPEDADAATARLAIQNMGIMAAGALEPEPEDVSEMEPDAEPLAEVEEDAPISVLAMPSEVPPAPEAVDESTREALPFVFANMKDEVAAPVEKAPKAVKKRKPRKIKLEPKKSEPKKLQLKKPEPKRKARETSPAS